MCPYSINIIKFHFILNVFNFYWHFSRQLVILSNSNHQLNFLNLSPADPVIEGIVGTVDSGVANTRVELINVGGHVVSTTVTNSGGYYVFRFPAPGTYTVRITPPDGFRASTTSTTVKIKMFEELQVDFLMNR